MIRNQVDLPIIELLELYCEEFSVRMGWDKDSGITMPRFLDKMISKGHFRSKGEIKLNPVILRLRGDYCLYWKQVYPVLAGAPVHGSALEKFFIDVHFATLLSGVTNNNVNLDEHLININVGGKTAGLTSRQLNEFYMFYTN